MRIITLIVSHLLYKNKNTIHALLEFTPYEKIYEEIYENVTSDKMLGNVNGKR